jgi:ATP-binding cassette subfamily B multidrug efflux pump
MNAPQSVQAPRLKGKIQFEHVYFSYEPEVEVLHDINLDIQPGTTTALVGPTGAGKSTIVNLMARFYDVSRGRILVDGYDLRNLDIQSYRGQLGLVLQDPFLFSGTVRDNIRYGNLKTTDEEMFLAAKTVGAHDFIVRLENGYDTTLEERGQNLSMGQRQLLSFARALVADPAILLLDEATASIDSYSEHVLQRGLSQLAAGRTTIVIAHRLSTVRNADCILVLDKGRVVEQGKHVDLLSKGGLYTRLYEMNYARVARSR